MAWSNALQRHEFNNVFNPFRDFVLRQTCHEKSSIRLRTQPVVQNSKNASVCSRSNEPAKSLLEADNRVRQLILRKSVSSLALDAGSPGGDERIRRNLKWKLVDNHRAQGIALYIDTLPEA